jgi:hypothetical protein
VVTTGDGPARILAVHRSERTPRLRAFHLDQPEVAALERYAFELGGWVVGTDATPVAVELMNGAAVWARTEIRLDRPDVARHLQAAPERCGFWLAVGVLGLPKDFSLVVRAVFADGGATQLGRIEGSYRLRTGRSDRLAPLTLSGLGRSGTTWLMRMLGAHPQIVVHDRHPYESRLCGYWMHAARVLAQPSPQQGRASAYAFAADPWHLPSLPYYYLGPRHHSLSPAQARVDDWLGHGQVQAVLGFAQDMVDAFYRTYGGAEALFFAEKGDPTGCATWMIEQLYPQAHEVFLVRDFRDVFVSVLAFNRRRGFDSFGRELVDTDLQYLDVLACRAQAVLDDWTVRSRHGALLLRYEDLVRDRRSTLGHLVSSLGLTDSPGTVEAMLQAGARTDDDTSRHRTSTDADASVGRWQDLSPSLRRRCEEVFAAALDGFGYPG